MSIGANKTILIVDDSDDDYDATARALRRDKKFKNPLRRCENGREALDYLFRRGQYAPPAEAPRPGIVLLDLNMPGIDGREVLATVKNDDGLRPIPIIIMTNSNDERDVTTCYAIGANTYIQKPLDWSEFSEATRRLREYWFDIAVLPKA
ncbi:MAG: response regulator [Alphaproteobacteria bacterium]|nr:response regulator [Alphaproteobacteria bacterium]